MGYSTIGLVQAVLNQSLTSASTVTTGMGNVVPGNLLNIGNTLNTNVIPTSDVNFYIQLADSHINSALSQQYVIPLKESVDLEMKLLTAIDEYTINEYNQSISVEDTSALSINDVLIFTNGSTLDRATVEAIIDGTTIEVFETPLNLYAITNTRVMRVKFPDPIPFISARLAAGALYNKYFMAQVEPGKSEYGDIVRRQALDELNNIREGRTILNGERRVGWRFANPELIERYNLKGTWSQDSTRSDQAK